MSDPSLDSQGKPLDSRFNVIQAKPLNAEPSSSSLTSHVITPTNLLFHRNHDDLVYTADTHPDRADSKWTVSLDLSPSLRSSESFSDFKRTTISLSHLKSSLPTKHVVATLECAGNRRGEFKHQHKAEGIQWGSGVIANVAWSGASLREALLNAGVPDPYGHLAADSLRRLVPSEEQTRTDAAPWSRDLHLHMHSTQVSSESDDPDHAEVFAASIPFTTAMHPNQHCILAYAHNGETLLPSHGSPLRAVVPGHAGARWVKWLSGLTISEQENQSPPMRLDYKILTPPKQAGEAGKKEWIAKVQNDDEFRKAELKKEKPLQRLGASSAITAPAEGEEVTSNEGGRLTVKGYAVGQDGSPTAHVFVAVVPDSDPSLPSHELVENLPDDVQWHPAELSFDKAAEAALRSRRRLEAAAPASAAQQQQHGQSSEEWSWAWCLWKVDIQVSAAKDGSAQSYAIIARSVTASGVEQERVSAWNLRGFCERGWPVVRGVTIRATPR